MDQLLNVLAPSSDQSYPHTASARIKMSLTCDGGLRERAWAFWTMVSIRLGIRNRKKDFIVERAKAEIGRTNQGCYVS